MRFGFEDDDLSRLYSDATFHLPRLHPEVVRAYRKKVTLIAAVTSQLELRQHKALRLEKLRGSRAGQHSVRLNDQWRLILRFGKDKSGEFVVIVEIADYH